jgi:hypothetical protein
MPLRCALLLSVLLSGCATAADSKSSSTTTKPSTRPTSRAAATQPAVLKDSVTVDLSKPGHPFRPRVTGVMRPKSAETPEALLTPLRPLLSRGPGEVRPGFALPPSAVNGKPPLLLTLSDAVRWDGIYPGQNGNWSKWDAGVDKAVRAALAEGSPLDVEIFALPDDKVKFIAPREEFWNLWVRTAHQVRKIDPSIRLVGPSTSKHDGGFIGEFLKITRDYDALPDVVAWSEPNAKTDMDGHADSTEEAFWQDGSDRRHVRVYMGSRLSNKHAPALMVFFVADIEKTHLKTGWRGVWEEFAVKLHHLHDKEGKPYPTWDVLERYAHFAGNVHKVDSSSAANGVAAYDPETRTLRMLIARDVARAGYPKLGHPKPIVDEFVVTIVKCPSPAAKVTVRPIGAPAERAAESTRTVAVKSGELKLPMPAFKSGDAAYLEVVFDAPPAP